MRFGVVFSQGKTSPGRPCKNLENSEDWEAYKPARNVQPNTNGQRQGSFAATNHASFGIRGKEEITDGEESVGVEPTGCSYCGGGKSGIFQS